MTRTRMYRPAHPEKVLSILVVTYFFLIQFHSVDSSSFSPPTAFVRKSKSSVRWSPLVLKPHPYTSVAAPQPTARIDSEMPSMEDVHALASELSGVYSNANQFYRITGGDQRADRRRVRRRKRTPPGEYRELRGRRERRRRRRERSRRKSRRGGRRRRKDRTPRENLGDQTRSARRQRRRRQRQQRRLQRKQEQSLPQRDASYSYPETGFTPDDFGRQSPLLIRSELYRVLPVLNLSLPDTIETVYFQDFAGHSAKPYRAGFYSIGLSPNGRDIRVRTHKLPYDHVTKMLPVPGRGGYKRHAFEGYIISQRQLEIAFGINTKTRKPQHPFKKKLSNAELYNTAFGAANSSQTEPDLESVLGGKLRSHGSCDMAWKRLSRKTFVGITGPECQGLLGTEQVHIGVSITLTENTMFFTEGWYRIKDGKPAADVRLPLIFEKKSPGEAAKSRLVDRVGDTKKGEAVRRHSKRTVEVLTNDLVVESDQRENRLQSEYDDFRKTNNIQDYLLSGSEFSPKQNIPLGAKDYQLDGIQSKHLTPHGISLDKTPELITRAREQAQPRHLRDFRQAAAALTSGFEVGFHVQLTSCLGPAQAKIDRLTFGGRVKDFVFVRLSGGESNRVDYVFFSSRKTVMDSQGLEFITRQVTLYPGRRVKVKIVKEFSEPSETRQEYMYTCKLYNDYRGNGGVKLFIDPTSQVNKIDSFANLATALGQGRDLRLVADLARCKGKHQKPAVVVGTYVTDYDLVNKGQAIEISIPISDPSNLNRRGWQPDKIVGHVLQNGDVMLTHVSNDANGDMRSASDAKFAAAGNDQTTSLSLKLGHAYHCKLANSGAIEDNDLSEEQHSIKVFYIL